MPREPWSLGTPISQEETDQAMGRPYRERMERLILKELSESPNYSASVHRMLEKYGWPHSLFAQVVEPLCEEGYVTLDQGPTYTITLTGNGIALNDSQPEV